MTPLAGLRVIDLSQRLPGPLAGMLLAELGAQVIKIEDHSFQDAFLEPQLAQIDDSFVQWYQELNAAKQIKRFDFSSPLARQMMAQELSQADIVLHALPEKLAVTLGLDTTSLATLKKPIAILQLGASQNSKTSMHDLNALAEAGMLHLHVAGQTTSPLAPPLLPIAGISFGQQVALTALALYRQAQQLGRPALSHIFLLDEILKVYRPFWTQQLRLQNRTKFLHNGKFPCYCLYRNMDGDWVAVAAVEEKFWLEFSRLLNTKLSASDRFSTEPHIFQTVADSIMARTTAELVELLEHKDICVSLIRTKP